MPVPGDSRHSALEKAVVVASVNKVQTLVDGGIRVVLDFPETAIPAAAWLMNAKREGKALKVTMEHG